VKYAFIKRHRQIWPICVQCRVLKVSASGFHQHRARRRKIAHRRHLSDGALLAHISAVYAEHRGAYGWRVDVGRTGVPVAVDNGVVRPG